MGELSKMDLSRFGGFETRCGCGETHSVRTRVIKLKEGAAADLAETVGQILPAGNVLVVTSEDCYERCARVAEKGLVQAGYHVQTHVYPKDFSPDLKGGGELFSYPENVRLAIAAGNEGVADCVRYYASVREMEYVMLPASPSSDEWLSDVAHLVVNGLPEHFAAKPPFALLADPDILCGAPRRERASGFGKIAAKYLALYDWYFAYAVDGEKYCDSIADLVFSAADRCQAASEGLIRGDRGGIAYLAEALIRCSAADILLGENKRIQGGARDVCQALSGMARHAKRSLRLAGEWEFLAAKKLFDVYKLFAAHPLSDLSLPPDSGLRAAKIAEYFGADEYLQLTKKLKRSDPESYELRMYRLQEYREDLVSMLAERAQKMKNAGKIFKRIYEDLGYSVSKSVSVPELKTAVAVAADLSERFSCLSLMRDIGLLDGYLK